MANTTNTTILSTADITAAKTAVSQYISTGETLFGSLSSIIEELRTSGFIGEASDGYKVFFDSLEKVLKTDLIVGDDSLMGSINGMLVSIQNSFLAEVDPQLGQANRNAIQ